MIIFTAHICNDVSICKSMKSTMENVIEIPEIAYYFPKIEIYLSGTQTILPEFSYEYHNFLSYKEMPINLS